MNMLAVSISNKVALQLHQMTVGGGLLNETTVHQVLTIGHTTNGQRCCFAAGIGTVLGGCSVAGIGRQFASF